MEFLIKLLHTFNLLAGLEVKITSNNSGTHNWPIGATATVDGQYSGNANRYRLIRTSNGGGSYDVQSNDFSVTLTADIMKKLYDAIKNQQTAIKEQIDYLEESGVAVIERDAYLKHRIAKILSSGDSQAKKEERLYSLIQ